MCSAIIVESAERNYAKVCIQKLTSVKLVNYEKRNFHGGGALIGSLLLKFNLFINLKILLVLIIYFQHGQNL